MGRLQDFNTVTPTAADNLLIVQSTGQGLASVGSTLGAKMDKINPTATGSLSLNRKAQTGIGLYSTAEGYNCEASGSGSHAEGDNTIANHNSQHVFGTYNLADTSSELPTAKGNYAEIVGNGTSTNSRSNARTLDWAGNEVLAGGLKVYGNKDVAVVNSFTNDITTTADGLAAITIPTGVGINNIFSIIVQNPSGVYLYGFLIKQPSTLWADIRQFNGTAYASQSCTIRLFYYVV